MQKMNVVARKTLASFALTIPHEVLEHRAVLTSSDGAPFSEVVETYTGEVLAFPEPQRP